MPFLYNISDIMDVQKMEQVSSIVKNMNASGMTPDQIKLSLKAMGLLGEDINQVMNYSKTAPTNQDIQKTVEAVKEKIETGDHLAPVATEIKKQTETTNRLHSAVDSLNEKIAGHEDHFHEIKENTVKSTEQINQVANKVEQLTQKHEELHQKVAEKPDSNKDMKELLLEIKGSINSLRVLNEKILDTNTKFLMRLK